MSRILGIDYGVKRIGLAIGHPVDGISFPLKVIELSGMRAAAKSIMRICEEKNILSIVIGLPLNMDGSEGKMAEDSRKFGEILGRYGNCQVYMWDERLTTCLVEKHLINSGVKRRKRRKLRDKLAAQQILQDFMESNSI